MFPSSLPGAELISQGLEDLARGSETIEALLVSIAAPRLRSLGYSINADFAEPELRLYRLLALQHGDDAHGRYNALIRRIVSFQRAAECAS